MKRKHFILAFMAMLGFAFSAFAQETVVVRNFAELKAEIEKTATESRANNMRGVNVTNQGGSSEDFGDVMLGADIVMEGVLEIPSTREWTLDLNGHTISGDADKYIKNLGAFSVQDNSASGTGAISCAIINGEVGKEAYLKIQNGTFKNQDGRADAAVITNYSLCEIYGGKFFSENIAMINHGEMSIDGGRPANVYIEGKNHYITNDGTLAVKNATIAGAKDDYVGDPNDFEDTVIFYNVAVNGKGYDSLSEAVAAATDGDFIRLFADVEESAEVVVNKAVTIDGNNKTLTSESTGNAIKVDAAGIVSITDITVECAAGYALDAVTETYVTESTLSGAGAVKVTDCLVSIQNTDLVGTAAMDVVSVAGDVTFNFEGGSITSLSQAGADKFFIVGGECENATFSIMTQTITLGAAANYLNVDTEKNVVKVYSGHETAFNQKGYATEKKANFMYVYSAVARVNGKNYRTLAAALDAATSGSTVELLYGDYDRTPISMAGTVNKIVTITGTADVDWSKGLLDVKDNLIFDNAKLTSASNGSSNGIDNSGIVVINNGSTVVFDNVINKGEMAIAGQATVVTMTNNGTIKLTHLDASLTAAAGLTVNTTLNDRIVVYADGAYKHAAPVAQTYKANGELVWSYSNLESAIAAATENADIARIVVNSDFTQQSVANTSSYYDIKNDLVIAAAEGQNYTVKGCGFALRTQNKATLTIDKNLTIEGLNVVANGFATSGDNMVIDGTVKALSLKQWTSNGTITVNGKVELGYGDGQFDMANGNGAVVVNGNGDKTVAQFKAGYSGTRGNGNTLTLNDTYFEAGAWFTVAGSNDTIDVNNSLLKVSGGDAAGTLTLAKNNTIYLDLNSQVVVAKFSGAGTINVDTEGITENVLLIKGNLSDFTGAINVGVADYKITNEGLVVMPAVAQLNGGKYYAKLQDAINACGEGDNTITLIDNVTEDVLFTQKEGVNIVLDGENNTFTGVMTINGGQRPNGTETLTIKNVDFYAVAGKDACITTGKAEGNGVYSYAHNVTIEGCDFYGNDVDSATKAFAIKYPSGETGYGLTVKDCTVDNKMFGFIWVSNVKNGLIVDNCTAIGVQEGITLTLTPAATIKNSIISAKGVVIRAGQAGQAKDGIANEITLENNELTSESDVIVVRGDATDAVLSMSDNAVIGATHISGNTADTKISADKNYWDNGDGEGDDQPTVNGNAVKVNWYYGSYVDGVLGDLTRNYLAVASIIAYTETDRYRGELWANAFDKLVIKLLDADNNVMGTASLKNEDLLDGDVFVSWYFRLNGQSSTSWDVEWITAPTINNMPVKVQLWIDDATEPIREDNVVPNGPDGVNKINVAIADADGRIWGYYTTMKAALEAVNEGEIITLLNDYKEDVVITQAPNVKITINGNNKNFAGTITVDGKSAAYATAGLTIKNVNFLADGIATDACVRLGAGTNETRYTSNVTVDNCTFTGSDKTKVGVKNYTGGCKNVTITNSKATGMHTLAQIKTSENVTLTNNTITKSKNGVSLGSSTGVVVKDCTVDVDGYGIRVDGNTGSDVTVENSTIDAFIPAVVRNATGESSIVFGEGNEFTASNNDNLWCAVGKSEYEKDGVLPTPATGNVTVSFDAEELNVAGVSGIKAGIGNVYYQSFDWAFAAVKADETLTLFADVEASEVILLDKSLTINGNDHKVTSSANRVFRVTASNTEVTLNNVNMVSSAAVIYPNDIRGISIDAGLENVELTLNNSSVDFTDDTACDWTYAVNVSGNGSGHTVTVNGGEYEGANVINVHGANNTVVVKGAELTSLYPKSDYYGACIWVLQNQGSTVEATGNTFNGINAVAFNVGTGTAVDESNNVDNTKLCIARVGSADYYYTIAEAVEAAVADATVTLLHSAEGAGAVINKNMTINLNDKRYTFTEGGLKFNEGNVTLKNGTLDATNMVALVVAGGNVVIEGDDNTNVYGNIEVAEGATLLIKNKGGEYTMNVSKWCDELLTAMPNVGETLYTIVSGITLIDGQFSEYTVAETQDVVDYIYYQRTLSSKKGSDGKYVWQAFYLPFEIPMSMLKGKYEVTYINDVRQSDSNGDGEIDAAVVEQIRVVNENVTLKANYPYLIRPLTEEDLNFVVSLKDATLYKAEEVKYECSSIHMQFFFTGNITTLGKSVLANKYALSGGIWKFGLSSMKPFRIYIEMSPKAGQAWIDPDNFTIGMRVAGEEDETGATIIYDVVNDAQAVDYIYDLQGRRVLEPQKGSLYIINGKKVVF